MDPRAPSDPSTLLPVTPGEPHVHEARLRSPRGVLAFPFVIATGLTILLAMGLQQDITRTWLMMAIVIGAVAAASSFAWALTHRPRQAPPTAPVLRATPAHEDPGAEDPLANVKAVETQARRHKRPCTNCGTEVGSQAEKCPNCGHRSVVQCKKCRTNVRLEWNTCPECGTGLP